ncbi:hypothetical protein [Streptomyces sp. NRRL F-5123]|uniref:hypothetical protein n=1 Tax=Streptomyces sp. NRRL F-5123 TaxID=1463856 RepID=UPI0005B9669E|nr:hypothetical protein [Streptomyces sp. NRRL F-5123]
MTAAAVQLTFLNVFSESVPHVIAGVIVAVLLGVCAWTARRVHIRWGTETQEPKRRPASERQPDGNPQPPTPAAGTAPDRPVHRTYTLLTTKSSSGGPERIVSPLPAGTTVVHLIDGETTRFVLTDTPLFDGSYLAEPIR